MERYKNYDGLYQISNFGNIKDLTNNKIKIPKSKNKHTYLVVRLVKNKNGKCFNVHRLVAEAFIPNPNNYPVVNHKDGNKQNNNVNNLEWLSFRQNSYHWHYCLKEENVENEDIIFLEKFTNISVAQVCRTLNVNRHNVLSGRADKEKIHLVRMELENKLKELVLNTKEYHNL